MPRQEVLRERLRPFEPCRGRTRAEAGEAEFVETIDDTGDERSLRTDNRQPDLFVTRQRGQAVDVLGCNGDVADTLLACRACVARSNEHFICQR